MSQTWTDDVYDPTHEADNDLQNMESNFASLKSVFSGSSEPTSPIAGMRCFNSSKKIWEIRDVGNSSWVGLLHGNTSQKAWVYRNSAMDGWVVDSSVSDRVLACKGGDIYTAGGSFAGGWTISGASGASHSHTYTLPDHMHPLSTRQGTATSWGSIYKILLYYSSTGGVDGTASGTTSSVGVLVNHDGGWRPAAAVGTLQRLNL